MAWYVLVFTSVWFSLTQTMTWLKWIGLFNPSVNCHRKGYSLKPGRTKSVALLSVQWCLSGNTREAVSQRETKKMFFLYFILYSNFHTIQNLKLIQHLDNMKPSLIFFFQNIILEISLFQPDLGVLSSKFSWMKSGTPPLSLLNSQNIDCLTINIKILTVWHMLYQTCLCIDLWDLLVDHHQVCC